MWPVTSAVNSDILQEDFFSTIERSEVKRFFGRLSVEKTMNEIVTTYPSLGSVPEIRQLSGVSGGGPRQAVALKDWSVIATAFEWEQTIPFRRIIAESKPEAVRSKTSQTAAKAMKGMDRTLCVALTASAVGYDGVALFSTAHPESGANQTNTSSTASGVNYVPTAAEWETALNTGVGQMKTAQDDQGTPVNEGVGKFIVLCHPNMEFGLRTAVSPLMSNQAIDTSGATGRYRGLVEVIVSAYCTDTGLTGGTADRAFLFAAPEEADERALALCRLADWQFNTNIGNDNSDDWQKGEGWIRSWAAFAYIPWQWQAAQRLIFT